MADAPKSPTPAAPAPVPNRPNPPVGPVKATPGGNPADPARDVADPASPFKTNPGPILNPERPALPGIGASNPRAPATTRAPNQPPVPAPSENVVPGPVGRPDFSRSPEEREQTRDAMLEAHSKQPGQALFQPVGVERTSDGKPDDSSVPQPTNQ